MVAYLVESFLRNHKSKVFGSLLHSYYTILILGISNNFMSLIFPVYHSFGDCAGGRLRHAFIGLGFRERAEAYDFQASLHDHMKYPKLHLYMKFDHFILAYATLYSTSLVHLEKT